MERHRKRNALLRGSDHELPERSLFDVGRRDELGVAEELGCSFEQTRGGELGTVVEAERHMPLRWASWLQMPSGASRVYEGAMLDFLRFARDLVTVLSSRAARRRERPAATANDRSRAEGRGTPALEALGAIHDGPGHTLAPAWRTVTMLVQPVTIIRWHRIGLLGLLRRRSRRLGRRSTLIREMAAKNPQWAAERIRGELLKLGIRVSKRTVQRYMTSSKPPTDGQR
jgi:hypothetical protein